MSAPCHRIAAQRWPPYLRRASHPCTPPLSCVQLAHDTVPYNYASRFPVAVHCGLRRRCVAPSMDGRAAWMAYRPSHCCFLPCCFFSHDTLLNFLSSAPFTATPTATTSFDSIVGMTTIRCGINIVHVLVYGFLLLENSRVGAARALCR